MIVKREICDIDLDISEILGEEWRGIVAEIRCEYRITRSGEQLYEEADLTEFAQLVGPDGNTINHTGKRAIKQKVKNYIECNPEILLQEDISNE